MSEEKLMWFDVVEDGKLSIPKAFKRNLPNGTKVKVYVVKYEVGNEVTEFVDVLNSLIYGELWSEYKRINNIKVIS